MAQTTINRSYITYIRKQLRAGVPESRLPLLCAQKFCNNISVEEWGRICRECVDLLKQSNTIILEKSTFENYTSCEANNPDIVFDLIKKGTNVFITGKAGTGKTTLLRKIVDFFGSRRNVVVAAPTGIAAKNAGGVTLHSLFKLPIGPWVPTSHKSELHDLDESARRLIDAISTVIIDEISMVRCDLLDEIDEVLRYVKGTDLPFGGVQLILFGDLYQLMPVAEEGEWDILKEHYDSPFFFSSLAYKSLTKTYVELTKVYRQEEPEFVSILDNIRLGKANFDQLQMLNKRYDPSYAKQTRHKAIRLTTHNKRADAHNRAQLATIPRAEHDFCAYIEGPNEKRAYIPKEDWPTDYHLNLKVGARVMFLRNDNVGKQYVNGTLGTVQEIYDDHVVVLSDEGLTVEVYRTTWDFYRYTYDKKLQIILKQYYASFRQLPLRLAWCVTIHKSQGLTFDKVYIDVANAFADGQTYVALSRCRTLKGIHLTNRITKDHIMASKVVKEFLDSIGKNADEKKLEATVEKT